MKLVVIAWIFGVLLQASSFGQTATNSLPETLEQLNSWYSEPPPGRNRASFFLKAMSAIQLDGRERKSTNVPWLGKAHLSKPKQPIPGSMRVAIREIARRNRTVLEQLNEGSGLAESRYPVDLSKGADIRLPHIDRILDTVRLLSVCVLHYADSNQPEEALKAIVGGLDLASSLKMEPLYNSQVERGRSIVITLSALEQLLNRSNLSTKSLTQLQIRLLDLEQEEAKGVGFSRALVGERVLRDSEYHLPIADHVQQLSNMLSQTIVTLHATAVSIPAPEDYPREADRKRVRETSDRLLEFWTYSYPQRLKLVKELRFSREYTFRRKNYLASLQTLFDGDLIVGYEAQCLAALRLARTGVALERFRIEQGGSFPESLSELVPRYIEQVPLDPFDGRSLRYSSTGLSFHLFSVIPLLASEPVTSRLFTFDVDHEP